MFDWLGDFIGGIGDAMEEQNSEPNLFDDEDFSMGGMKL